jgi:hypothetical protein
MDKSTSKNLPLSKQTEVFDKIILKLKRKYTALWWETETSPPEFPNTYSKENQQKTEKDLGVFVNRISKSLDDYSYSQAGQKEIMHNLINQSKNRLWKTTQSSGLYFSEEFNNGIKKSSKIFLEKVKQYDPKIEMKYIYQAMRNLWIMNSLQDYLNVEMTCSDSMFAYSMLYPYTDNIMDDVKQSVEYKLHLHLKLKKWLEGDTCLPSSAVEKKIFTMVKLIEGEFPREKYPLVFPSVLTIFNAQLKSLDQQKKEGIPYVNNILDISFEKGGTSVLADGFLLAGDLDEKQLDFCFCYGAFLQFADDIQDVLVDKKNFQMTIFSQLANSYPLDQLANKLLNFITTVSDLHLSDPIHESLRKTIISNCYFLIIRAIGKNRQLYNKNFVQEIERHFPIRFNYFDKTTKKLTKIFRRHKGTGINIDTLIETFSYLASN